jgi:peptidoglycan-associated lipoprotein
MRSINLNRLFALALVASLAACQSTPEQEDTAETEQQDQQEQQEQQQTAEPEPTEPSEPAEAMEDEEEETTRPVTADNFHNHPSNYDASTDTRTIHFAFDKSTVPSAAFGALKAHARHLKSNSNARVRLAGHTDERGTREYNVALGERRAKAVQKYLRLQGVSSDQLETVSYGEEKPARRGSSDMDYAHNRRVEIEYRAGRP